MREIIFRGKRKDNGEWVYGSLSLEYLRECGSVVISPTSDTCYKVAPKTVGQYTGITDKNGKKIFEGDIVKIGSFMPGADDWVCAIDWDYALFEEYKYVWKTKCEVIGNIHDNPELLEVTDNA